jgi:hypothetical protein
MASFGSARRRYSFHLQVQAPFSAAFSGFFRRFFRRFRSAGL